MARLIFENLTTKQAKTLAEWFEGEGEQKCDFWFEVGGVPSPMVNVELPNCIEQIGEDIHVKCYTP